MNNTPLSNSGPMDTSLNRTQSREMVDDMHHPHIVDEDPLLISQTLTYVTDDGSVVHSFQSAPFSWGKWVPWAEDKCQGSVAMYNYA